MSLPHVTLAQPMCLALAGAALLPILAAWRARRQRPRRWAVVAQVAALLLLSIALAEPTLYVTSREPFPLLVCLDRSGSVRGLTDWPAPPKSPPTQVVYFAGNIAPATSGGSAPAVDANHTRLGPLLDLIGARAGKLSGAVIATDGQFTDEWQTAARSLGRKVPLLIVPMTQTCQDARIADFTAQRTTDGSVELAASCIANQSMTRRLEIIRAGRQEPLLSEPVQLLPDLPLRFLASDRLADTESATYTAWLIGDTVITENDHARMLMMPRAMRIALVDWSLKLEWPTQAVNLSASALPDAPEALSAFSAIFVSDADGRRLTSRQRQALTHFVQSGGTLFYAGPPAPSVGADDFGKLLPLVDGRSRRHPLSLRIVLDASGSMAQPAGQGQRKFDLAAQAALSLQGQLSDRDSLCVITFADEPRDVYDSQDSPPDFAALADALRGVSIGGSTRIIPAIQRAMEADAHGREAMILVLSDLQTEQFTPQAWADHIAQANVKLAVVAVGAPSPEPTPLEELCRLLAAPYRHEAELKNLAELFAQLVVQARGESLVRQPANLRLLGPVADLPAPAIDSFFLSAPALSGLVLATATDDSPVLAQSAAGLGTCIQLAGPGCPSMDAAPTAAGVQAWSRLLGRLVEPSSNAANSDFDGRFSRDGQTLKVTISAFHGPSSINGLRLTARVWPTMAEAEIPLRQIAPGQYEARLPLSDGNTPAAVSVRRDGLIVWRGSVPVLPAAEYAHLGVNEENLKTLSALTSAKLLNARADLAQALDDLDSAGPTSIRPIALWPWLIGVALGLLLADWAILSRR